MMLLPSPSVEPATAPAPSPHNIEAEQQILGAILYRNENLEHIEGVVEPFHFYDPLHADIFDTVVKLVQAGKQANPVTLKAFYENAPPISDKMSVQQYLGKLVAQLYIAPRSLKDYGKLLRDLALRRHLIHIGRELADNATHAALDIEPSDLIEEAESLLYAATDNGAARSRLLTAREAVARAVESANAAFQRRSSGGLSTGLRDLDHKLGGLQPSDLIILAGRPSMGKTALATNIAKSVAGAGQAILTENGELKTVPAPVLFCSLEMSAEQLVHRLICEVAKVPGQKMKDGTASEDEIKRYVIESEGIAALPLHIEETGGMGVAQLAAVARRFKRRHGLGLLVIDYLQLMGGSGKRGDNRVQEITEITTGLKALAKELGVPVLALSQLSRAVEQRENKRPQLSDLRESGSIEQDADVVMFVFREEYYIERMKPDEADAKFADWQSRMLACRNKAEVILGKHRHGPVGTVSLHFDAPTTKFSDLAVGYAP